MPRLVLLRHGQSEWNLQNRFTGWVDVDLSPKGEAEAVAAGRLLRDEGILPDVVHTSTQRRAIRTAELVLHELGEPPVPVRRSWQLNERHYGALQGLDKRETALKHGDEQVKLWRRSYATRPPPLSESDRLAQHDDPAYAELPLEVLPASESLADVVDRLMPYWSDEIVPDLTAGRVVLVVAHGNSLRALVKHLDDLSEAEVLELNIPTGVPLVYDLDDDMRPIRGGSYLGDADEIRAATDAVQRQTE
jgi:2,3-bisphosphoglycerate-dependent phosphoglycerate mutase